jgi:hypothetical protein
MPFQASFTIQIMPFPLTPSSKAGKDADQGQCSSICPLCSVALQKKSVIKTLLVQTSVIWQNEEGICRKVSRLALKPTISTYFLCTFHAGVCFLSKNSVFTRTLAHLLKFQCTVIELVLGLKVHKHERILKYFFT